MSLFIFFALFCFIVAVFLLRAKSTRLGMLMLVVELEVTGEAAAMPACAPCMELDWKSAKTPPHDDLTLATSISRFNGELETWRCRVCRMKWRRLIARDFFSGKPQYWFQLGTDTGVIPTIDPLPPWARSR
jgi:hypothetical protein